MWNEVLDELIVVKRSGQRVEFNASKIAIAIKKAYESTYDDIDEKKIYKIFEKVLAYINSNYCDRKTISVEDIQDIIEKILQAEEEKVYISFREYRHRRAASRRAFAEKQQHKFVKAIEKVQEQSNSEHQLTSSEKINNLSKIIFSEYAKSYVLDTKFVRALEEGNIYIHNLDYFSLGIFSHFNYLFSTKNDLNKQIYNIKNAEIEINNIINLGMLDYKLIPYIITKYKEIAINNLKKYLKLLGFHSFINIKKYEELINKALNIEEISDILANLKVNDALDNALRMLDDFSKEELNDYIKSTVEKIFRILNYDGQRNTNFNISIGFNNDPLGIRIKQEIINYLSINEPLKKVTVIFKITEKTKEEDLYDVVSLVASHKNIKLLFVSFEDGLNAEYFADGLKVYESINQENNLSEGKLAVGETSINLARLGFKYRNRKLDGFYQELDSTLDLIKNQLLINFESIGNKTRDNYKILFKGNVYDDEKLDGNQKIRKVIKSGTLYIGVIGLIACVNLLEENEDKKYKLLMNILQRIKDKCQQYSEENKIKFAMFEPSDIKPREYLIKIDKSIYGVEKNITNKTYYEKVDRYITDLIKYKEVEKLFDGGMLYETYLSANISSKRIYDLIKNMQKLNIGLVKINIGKV